MIVALALALLPAVAQSDSLTLEAFLARVRDAHPVARQAEAVRQQAREDLRAARGGFDPSVSATWDYKRFKGIGYYDEVDARLTVPTPWGVDVKVGWERAAGAIINPERKTPGTGLLSAGLSIPIGPRLLTDERRTGVRQAELAAEAADADADATLVRLLQQAARDWGAWYEADARAGIARDGVTLARFRLDAVRSRVREGDVAAIDSVEALAEWDRRLLAEIDASAALASARLVVSGHLWDANGAAVALPPTARPRLGAASVADGARRVDDAQLVRLAREHPSVLAARARWLQAEAQRRLVLTQVLPSASAEVSALGAGSSLGSLPALSEAADDAKAGVSVRIPLFARRELGRLRAAEARTRQLATERDRVMRDVQLAAERAAIELAAVEAQVAGQARVLAANEVLLAAEQRRFDIGESSLLIVNLRERAVLDERQRAAQLEARRATALGALAAALGTPAVVTGETAGPSRR
ncbi:MAG: TolC family protein [Gemmatimonadetes bacterium]|nr:TolC family protein [Gemmatimonadota bacterium]